jgi:hypothetical protein
MSRSTDATSPLFRTELAGRGLPRWRQRFTQTCTGNVTLTAYPPSSLSFDNQGNATGIVGPPDASVPVFSGKITEWFGGQFNNKNSNNTGTFTVSAVGGG